uniref:G_PROTEIN_RECEP_F1_2 domain-containing protein n=1 Tax=Strongyloides venezuelensis TaxID=75913 RepID=A0A0K0EYL8_STRVS
MSACVEINETERDALIQYYLRLIGTEIQMYDKIHVYIYQILCLLGVPLNILIIVVLLRPQMRKNPFNLYLIVIAICDLILMANYYIFHFIERCHPYYYTYIWIIYTKLYAITSVLLHSLSLWLTVIMAIHRYIVVKNSNGSQSKISWNSYKITLLGIGIAICISLIGSTPNTLRYEIQDNGLVGAEPRCLVKGSKYAHYYTESSQIEAYQFVRPNFWNCNWERLTFWIAGLLLKVIPCMLLTIFMTLLVRILIKARERRNRLCGSRTIPCTAKTQAERTTAMLTIIVAVFLVTELPQGLLILIKGVYAATEVIHLYLGQFLDFLALLNSSVNFILYTTMSYQFRSQFIETFATYLPKTFERISGSESIATNVIPSKIVRNGSQNNNSTFNQSKIHLLSSTANLQGKDLKGQIDEV